MSTSSMGTASVEMDPTLVMTLILGIKSAYWLPPTVMGHLYILAHSKSKNGQVMHQVGPGAPQGCAPALDTEAVLASGTILI